MQGTTAVVQGATREKRMRPWARSRVLRTFVVSGHGFPAKAAALTEFLWVSWRSSLTLKART